MAEEVKVEEVKVAEGDYLAERLVTDTRVYKVVKVSATGKTLTLARCGRGDVVKSDNIDGNPYPVVWTEAVAYEDEGFIVRLRKDGTFRLFKWANPLRPATMIDGKPVTRTDYRY